MPRMDPDFASAFNNEYPEAYSHSLKSSRKKNWKHDSSLAVHIPVIPPSITRFVSGVIIMLMLIGAFFAIDQANGDNDLSMPTGKRLNESQSLSLSSLNNSAEAVSSFVDPKSDLSSKVSSIGSAGSNSFSNAKN